ncbi:peptide ABC transporter substrate-binding protein [Paenibacillus sp. NPDC058177]|uniref:peptide ABC transporter substrate-binding protein n=1 Tax=Paenibacillus sp. NPDC058177 TaxID=3346369 RepID=UPI0036D8357C
MKNKIKFISFALATMLLFTGCSSSNNKNSQSIEASGSGEKVVTFAKDVDIISLDTSLASDGFSLEMIETFTDGLVDYDKSGNIIPRIATEWSKNDSGTVYKFNLRKDAKWSNGDPVTAKDFVYSWRRAVDPATASEYAGFVADSGIKNAADITSGKRAIEDLGVKALDDNTLEVTLETAVPYFIKFLPVPIFNPLNEKFVKEQGDKYAQEPKNLLSNGPFIFSEWNKLNSWKIVKNPTYYAANEIKVDEVDFVKRQDYSVAALEFEKGNIDVTKISSELVPRYANNKGFTSVLSGYVWYLSPNNQFESLKNKNLRLALGYAIDRDHIANDILKDGSEAADYIVPKGLSTDAEGKDFRETSSTFQTYNIDKANEYLAKAKQELGVTNLTLELLIEDSSTVKKTAEAIQADLQALEGITINIVTVTKAERLKRMKTDDYQLGLTRWGPNYGDPYDYLGTLFLSTSNFNYPKFNNPAYDELLKKTAPGGQFAKDDASRWSAFKEAEKLLLQDEGGALPVYQAGEAMLINPNVQGVEYFVVGGLISYRNLSIQNDK